MDTYLYILTINILWIFYSLLEGFREAYYWHYKNISNQINKFDIHPIFSIQRSILLISFLITTNILIGWTSIINIIGLSLIFSFFHNGMYYLTRNKLDSNIYKLKWKDLSKTSTAKLTKLMTYRNRLIFLIIGLFLQIIFYIL